MYCYAAIAWRTEHGWAVKCVDLEDEDDVMTQVGPTLGNAQVKLEKAICRQYRLDPQHFTLRLYIHEDHLRDAQIALQQQARA